MKAKSPFLFLVFDVLLQATAVAATFLALSGTWILLLLGAGWQLFSYNTLYAWSNKSKYRKAYISVSLFTLGLLAVGLLFIGIGIALNSYVVVVGMFVLGASMLLGVALYISYFIITLSSLAIEIKKCIKRIRENFAHKLHEQNLGDWWV